LDKADYSPGWLHLFNEPSGCGHPFSSITSLKPRSLRLYDACPQDGPLAGEVAFRICAIREFFEEAGILLARDRDKMAAIVDAVPGTCSPSLRELSQAEMTEWRERVHNDANEFIAMCR
jgi:nucleoside diphosphate-linked moiety X motif protein 19